MTAQVVATLRTLAYRDGAIASLTARFDPDTGHLAEPGAGDPYVPAGFARGVRRQLAARARRKAVDALAHTAAGEGIEVVAVPGLRSAGIAPGWLPLRVVPAVPGRREP